MAENAKYEIDGLRFEQLKPHKLRSNRPGRWTEIQRARIEHYRRVLPKRSALLVSSFVLEETMDYWDNPNKAVGDTAIPGQRRVKPRVIAAFDERTDELKGFVRGAVNVSSRKKPEVMAIGERFAKLHVPLASFRASRYLWGSEVVNPEDRSGLDDVLVGLFLSTADPSLPGSWYPYAEEQELRELLTITGYTPDRHTEGPQKGRIVTSDEYRFGLPSEEEPAKQQRWTVPSLAIAYSYLVAQPERATAIRGASETMSSH